MGQPVALFSYFTSKLRERDWTQQELAEFYRVEHTLIQHALGISTGRGVTDEGDPWFVFCRADDEEVIAHIARIGSQYVVVSSAFSGIARGDDFRALLQTLMEAHPLMLPSRSGQARKVILHPTALLSAFVATAFLISAEKGAPVDHTASGEGQKPSFLSSLSTLLQDKVAIISAIAVAATFVEKQVELALNLASDKPTSDSDASSHVLASQDTAPAVPDSFTVQQEGASGHKMELASLDSHDLGSSAQVSEHIAPGSVVATTPAAAIGDKVIDGSATAGPSSIDASKLVGHDMAIALPDSIATPATVPGTGSAQVNIAGHQPSVVSGNSSTSPFAQTAGDIFNLANGPSSSQALHLVAQDLGSGSITPGHDLPIIIGLTSQNAAQSLIQLGYSPNNAEAVWSMTGHASDALAGPIAPVAALSPSMSNGGTAAPNDSGVVTAPININTGSLPVFDNQAGQVLQAFINSTPNLVIGMDNGGKNLILIDSNPADMQNHNFQVAEWQAADGSTVTLVGIIPHAAHTVTG